MSAAINEQAVGVSVVIPVYSERDSLDELYRRLRKTLDPQPAAYELIFVDDGSTDQSWEFLKALNAKDARVKIIRFRRNFGQHAAVRAGFRYALGSTIVTLDADLQNFPEDIPGLLQKLSEGYDFVCGWRSSRHDPWLRKLGSRIFNWLVACFTQVKLHDYGCLLRAYRREIVELILKCPETSTYVNALTSLTSRNIAEVEVSHAARKKGKSRYSLTQLTKLFFNLVTGFSIIPIQVINFIGFLLAIAGITLGGVTVVQRLLYGPGPAKMMTFVSVSLFFFGFQLFSLGIIGEYVGRIYIEVLSRPLYFIESTIGFEKTEMPRAVQ